MHVYKLSLVRTFFGLAHYRGGDTTSKVGGADIKLKDINTNYKNHS